jgi:hypothetical protein
MQYMKKGVLAVCALARLRFSVGRQLLRPDGVRARGATGSEIDILGLEGEKEAIKSPSESSFRSLGCSQA